MKKNALLMLGMCAVMATSFSSCNFSKPKANHGLLDSGDTTKRYTVTWNNYNDSFIDATFVAEGEMPAYEGEIPTRPNQGKYRYIFSGWEPEFTNVTEDVTYTATYTPEIIDISITWLNEDGTVIFSKDDYHVGDTVTFPEDPTKEDNTCEYFFSYWVDENNNRIDSIELDGKRTSYTLKPFFDKKEYTITWRDYNNNFLATSTVKSNEIPTYPLSSYPTRPDDSSYAYSFVGWTTEVVRAHSDATYIAKYSSRTLPIRVKWLYDDGTIFKEEEYQVGTGTVNAPITNPSKKTLTTYDWSFKGWKTDDERTPSECPLDGSQMTYVFNPIFELQKFTITWKNYDDTVLETQQVNSGVMPSTSLTPKQKPSDQYKYTFDGWDPMVTKAHRDQVYKVKLKKEIINISVNFYKEDGTSIISTKSNYHVGDIINVPTAPTKESVDDIEYEFDHWEGLNGEILPTTALDGSVLSYNFKAVYKENGFSVKFVDYNGTPLAKITTQETDLYIGDFYDVIPSDEVMETKATNRENARYTYEFAGWAVGNSSETDPVEDPTTHLIPKDSREDDDPSTDDIESILIDGSITIHAVYCVCLKEYEVTFYGQDEDEKLDSYYEYYGEYAPYYDGMDEPSSCGNFTDDVDYKETCTWNGGFQYKEGGEWKSGFTKVKGKLDYYATYDKVISPSDAFYFTSNNDFSVALTKSDNSAPNVNIEYSKDGKTWNTYTTSTESDTISQTANKKLYFRGKGNIWFSNSTTYHHFVLTGSNVVCKGNIETLLNYSTVFGGNNPTKTSYCYSHLFFDCAALTEAPALPSTLTASCCEYMFSKCTALTKTPTLPATALADSCYRYMFSECTSLTETTELPATNLASGCYSHMFNDCRSLTKAPTLPAMRATPNCYYGMFQNNTSLRQAPELPATSVEEYCYTDMFAGCCSMLSAPSTLPAKTLYLNCYGSMFSCCTSLTETPTLPALTLAQGCYGFMFNFCTSLVKVSSLPATTLYTSSYRYMFTDCTSLKICEEGSGYKIFTCPSYVDSGVLINMFLNTGGTFKSTPTAGKNYYYYY